MKNNLLDAYLDGFEMAKEMAAASKSLSWFTRIGRCVNLNTNHAIKMSEYAKHDLNIKEAEEPLMSNEEINKSLLDDCSRLTDIVHTYVNLLEESKSEISRLKDMTYKLSAKVNNATVNNGNAIDIAAFIKTLDSVEVMKDKYMNKYKCTRGAVTVSGVSLIECHDKLLNR